MSKNLRRDVARGERRILGSRTAKNVSGWIGQARWPDLRKSCGDLYTLMHGGLVAQCVEVVGLTGFEPVTLRLSSACSNQLSYRPY